MSQKSIPELHAELKHLLRRIELKAFEHECASLLSSRSLAASDYGWLLSIVASSAGTAMAVLNGQVANDWSDAASTIHDELTALIMDRKILEWQIAQQSG